MGDALRAPFVGRSGPRVLLARSVGRRMSGTLLSVKGWLGSCTPDGDVKTEPWPPPTRHAPFVRVHT